MNGLLSGLAGFVTAAISAGGYLGILGLMAVESACVPLPSELIMPFAGYLASTGRFNLVLAATFGALGCNLGSAIAYAVGRHGGRRAVLRYGRYVLLSPGELDRMERFFARFGPAAVFVGRMLPVVRTFIALPAGLARMQQGRFHLYTFLGSWPWCFGLALVGYELGALWNRDPAFARAMHRADVAVVALVVVAAAVWLWSRMRRRG